MANTTTLIARYLIGNELRKCEVDGKPYYKMCFRSCTSSGFAHSDEEAIEIFARWCGVPTHCIERV